MIIKTKNKLIVFSLILLFTLAAVPYRGEASLVGNTNNAILSLSPNVGVHKTDNSYAVDILLNTHGQNVVAVAAYLSYNPSLFQVVSIDGAGTVFTAQVVQPDGFISTFTGEIESVIDNVNGKVKITRGIPTPGVNTVSGKVVTLNIKGLTDVAPAADNFIFDFTSGATNDSNIVLNDGLGTDIISGVDNGKYTFDSIAPANITSFTAAAGDGQISLSWTNPINDFTGVTILRKTGSYPASPTDGTVVYDGSGTSYNSAGLVNGTAYFYKAFSHDTVLNYASGAQASATPQSSGSVVPPSDTTPPASIANLSATSNNARSITLNWTAVGDNGNTGMAANYDIRYSTSAITVANFSTATQAIGKPTPKTSGSAESMIVTGLSGFTTYYFAIKAVDASGNTGIISNLPSAKTYKTADLNNNNLVNSVDFGIMMSFWNSLVKPAADINQDGFVNSVDFGIMMSQWG